MARILFVNNTGSLSGPARSLLKLFKYIRVDHDVAVLVPDEGDFTGVLTRENIPWHIFPFRYRHLPALVWLVWRGKYDLVSGNNFSGAAWQTLIAAKLTRRPFIWHLREVFAEDHLTPEVFRRPRHADAIIAVSKASVSSVKRYVSDKEIFVVYNGVDIGDFSIARSDARRKVFKNLGFSDESVFILNVGHLCPRKNQTQAIDAIVQIIQKYPFVKCGFLGRLDHTPSYTNALKEKIARLGLEENIRLLGFQKDVATYFRGADILMHTSLKDPHPRSVIEGMAAKLPVVAFDVDGVSETVVSGETGFLVPSGDVMAMVQAIQELVNNPSLRIQMGEAGCKLIQEYFTAEKTAQQVSSVIVSVLRK